MVEDGKTDNCFEGKNNIFFQERKATKWTMEVEYVASCVIVRGNIEHANSTHFNTRKTSLT
jgi:hypothetical protein